MYLLHRTRVSGNMLNTTPMLRRMDMAVTSCRLPLSQRGARSYPMDPAYPSTMLVYEVTTVMPRAPTLRMDKQSTRASPKAQRPIIQSLNIWPNHTRHTTHDEHKHGLINYRDSTATMIKLYIMNRVLTERIQSHTESRGSLNDSEDDLIR